MGSLGARPDWRLIPLSTGGVPSIRDGLAFGVSSKGYREGVTIPEDVREVMAAVQQRDGELNSVGDIAGLLREQFRERPAAVLKLFAVKAARSWYGTDSQRFELPILLLQLGYLGAAAGGTIVAVRGGGGGGMFAVLVWLLVLYFWGMTLLVLPLVRYMLPAMVLLFVVLPALVSLATSPVPARVGALAKRPAACEPVTEVVPAPPPTC